jgi:hypothetical protein
MRSQLLIAALAAGACASAPRPQFPARPPGCALEPVERLPQRPYIELETFSVPGPESMREVLDLVSERACRDGADAVYAPKGGRTYSYAIALKWRPASLPPVPPVAPSSAPPPVPPVAPVPAPPAPVSPPAPTPPVAPSLAPAPSPASSPLALLAPDR